MNAPKVYKVHYDDVNGTNRHFYAVDVDGKLKAEFNSEIGSLNGSAITSFEETPEILIDPVNALFDPKKTHVFQVTFTRKSTQNGHNNCYPCTETVFVVAKSINEAMQKLEMFETDDKDKCDIEAVISASMIGDYNAKVYV